MAKEAKPKTDPLASLINPSNVDDGVRNLIARFGASEVKASIKKLTIRKGNLPIKTDWPKLVKVYQEDAIGWLKGGDPFKSRTNHRIATSIASEEQENRRASIYRRILRKLKQDRTFYTFLFAAHDAEKHYPYALHIKAIVGALRACPTNSKDKAMSEALRSWKRRAKSGIKQYRELHGNPPAEDLTSQQIDDFNRKEILNRSSMPFQKFSLGKGLLG